MCCKLMKRQNVKVAFVLQEEKHHIQSVLTFFVCL